MTKRRFLLDLARFPGPRSVAIQRAVAAAIDDGRLVEGDRLPGSRTLAQTLGVHRNTVVAAFRELVAEGRVVATRGRGTVVAAPAAALPPARRGGARGTGFAIGRPRAPTSTATRPVLSLDVGLPDVRLAPADLLARAYRTALRDRSVLAYGEAGGHPRLRAAIARMLGHERALVCGPRDVAITRGSQMAIAVLARVLVRPGDVVAVEEVGYRMAWEALRGAGARLHGIAVDREGLDVDALARLAARTSIRMVYLTPHHQYPTMVTLSGPRRQALLALARRHRFAIVEDDYDHEFHYEGRPVAPLASLDRDGVVVYVASFSKVLAPGVRVGYAVGPRALVDAMIDARRLVDRQGDLALELALCNLLEDGEVGRFVRRIRRVNLGRRTALLDALQEHLGHVLEVHVPAGGMAVWAEAPEIDVDAWARRTLARGVAIAPGSRFTLDGSSRAAVRLGFAASTESELVDAVRCMADALPTRRRR